MRRPLLKLILAALAWPLSLLVAIPIYEVVLEYFTPVGRQPPNLERIQHKLHHPVAVHALQQYAKLPKARQEEIKASLEATITDVGTWTQRLEKTKSWTLCIGEQHDEHTRYFLAKELLPRLTPQVMMLETTPDGLAEMEKLILKGEAYVPLLKADISAIMRGYWARDPDFTYFGIEETSMQKDARDRTGKGSRDQNITRNFFANYQKEGRNIVLIGALHCRNNPGWLYRYLELGLPETPGGKPVGGALINVLVIGEHQDGPAEAFVYFLDEIGLKPKSFAIAEADKLDPWIWDTFALFADQSFRPYSNIIIFRFEGQAPDRAEKARSG